MSSAMVKLSNFILQMASVSCWACLACSHILTNQTHCVLCCCQHLGAGPRYGKKKKKKFSMFASFICVCGFEAVSLQVLQLTTFQCLLGFMCMHMGLYNRVSVW